jgi:hypothetical protein
VVVVLAGALAAVVVAAAEQVELLHVVAALAGLVDEAVALEVAAAVEELVLGDGLVGVAAGYRVAAVAVVAAVVEQVNGAAVVAASPA